MLNRSRSASRWKVRRLPRSSNRGVRSIGRATSSRHASVGGRTRRSASPACAASTPALRRSPRRWACSACRVSRSTTSCSSLASTEKPNKPLSLSAPRTPRNTPQGRSWSRRQLGGDHSLRRRRPRRESILQPVHGQGNHERQRDGGDDAIIGLLLFNGVDASAQRLFNVLHLFV